MGIECYRGKYRIRTRYRGRQYCLCTGINEGILGRAQAAEIEARMIQDSLQENFDISLDRYRGHSRRKRHQGKESTLREVYEALREGKGREWARNTQSSYLRAIILWEKHGTLAACQKALEAYSPESQRVFTSRLNYLLREGYEMGMLKHLEKIEISGSKTGSEAEPDPLTKDEVKLILQSIQGHRYSPLVRLKLLTGCRTGEALALRWSDIDYSKGHIIFRHNLDRKQLQQTKTGKARYFPINDDLRAVLKEIRATCTGKPESSDFLFYSMARSEPLNSALPSRWWKDTLKALGIRHRRFYCTRHTFISHALEGGVQPIIIAKLVGNSPQIIYRHYANLIDRPDIPSLY